MDDHGQRQECAREFERLRETVSRLDEDSRKQGEAIARVETNIINLAQSMDRLTTAIWGIVIAVAGFGLVFVVGTLQGGFVK